MNARSPSMANLSLQVLICGLLAAPALADVAFTDRNFVLADWTVQRFGTGTSLIPFTGTVTQETAGGNPAAFRRHMIDAGAGTVATFHIYTLAIHDPAAGAIGYIDYSFDIRRLAGSMRYALLVQQDNNYYVNFSVGTNGDHTASDSWTTASVSRVYAGGFQRVAGPGPATRPDFSAAGSPIRFGFRAINQGTPSEGGIDNFRVTLGISVPCEDQSTQPGGFFDGDFLDTNWTLEPEIDPLNNSSFTAGSVATGGNPGSYRRIHNMVGAGTAQANSAIYSMHVRSGAAYNPAVNGAIQSIDYCEQAISLLTPGIAGQGQATGPLIRQNGKLYVAREFTNHPDTWDDIRLTGLTAAHFRRLVYTADASMILNANEHPDFSANAPLLEFGFYRANSSLGPASQTAFGIDNWSLRVNTITSLSAASYVSSAVAPESFVAGYGTSLASGLFLAGGLPLPTVLGQVSVRITDSAGVQRLAELVAVSASQINFVVPPATSPGLVQIQVVSQAGAVLASGSIRVARVAPGIFSANANGQGVAAATALKVTGSGQTTSQFVMDCATAPCVPAPIDMGSPSDQIYLTLYGTGIRGRNRLEDIEVAAGGIPLDVGYGGPQNEYPALDQINAGPLPRSLIGRGVMNVEVRVEGVLANVVTIRID